MSVDFYIGYNRLSTFNRKVNWLIHVGRYKELDSTLYQLSILGLLFSVLIGEKHD